MNKGFTLIELMITMVILVILLGIATPSFVNSIKNNKINTATRNIAAALKEARSEAIARQSVVTVASGGDWATGLAIYTDADAAGNTAFVAANDTLIKNINFSMDGVTVDGNVAGTNFISFTNTGLLNEGGNTIQLALCDDRGTAEGWQVSINLVGRATISDNPATCTP